MLDQVAAAFDRQDYKTAAALLKQLSKQSPNHPWVKFYTGRLYEVSNQLEAAESIYRNLLRETTNPKLALQSRQGLQRLEEIAQVQKKEAIARAAADPSNAGMGFLILEPVQSEARPAAIPAFSKLMKLDAYTARIHLSHRAWRLYRTGEMGELQFYTQALEAAGIPAFCVAIAQVQTVRVFRVQYVQTITPKPSVVCYNEADQLGTLAFDWQEISGQVEGMLPIFEEVVDLGPWNQLKRKEATQDYAQLLDLHLPRRNCLLRFCDRTYQFQQGIYLSADANQQVVPRQATTRLNWNNLIQFFQNQLSQAAKHTEFTPFAETALEHLEGVKGFESHVDLFRKDETYWDEAFHLYSCLNLLK
jgi:tetratricopeptide (TPR) repeat protein